MIPRHANVPLPTVGRPRRSAADDLTKDESEPPSSRTRSRQVPRGPVASTRAVCMKTLLLAERVSDGEHSEASGSPHGEWLSEIGGATFALSSGRAQAMCTMADDASTGIAGDGTSGETSTAVVFMQVVGAVAADDAVWRRN